MRKFIIAFLIIALAVLAAGCENSPSQKKTGGKDFTLTDLEGNPVSLSDYRGKVVMLEFWATWCAPCRLSVPELIELHEKYGDRGFAIIAISLDEVAEKVREFKEEFDIPYVIVIDDKDVNSAYGVFSIPTTFLLDKNGEVVKKHMGFARGVGDDFAKEIEALL